MPEFTSDDFRAGMRHLAAAVSIVSSLDDDKAHGLLATAICSVSADPPMLLACINRSATLHRCVRSSGHFCVNVLRTQQHALAKEFLGRESARRFDTVAWSRMRTGAPAVDGALISFDCEVDQMIEAGTHAIFIGRVIATRSEGEDDPLLYFRSAYAALGVLPEDGVPMVAG